MTLLSNSPHFTSFKRIRLEHDVHFITPQEMPRTFLHKLSNNRPMRRPFVCIKSKQALQARLYFTFLAVHSVPTVWQIGHHSHASRKCFKLSNDECLWNCAKVYFFLSKPVFLVSSSEAHLKRHHFKRSSNNRNTKWKRAWAGWKISH